MGPAQHCRATTTSVISQSFTLALLVLGLHLVPVILRDSRKFTLHSGTSEDVTEFCGIAESADCCEI